jgi:hypothetical protein
MQTSATSSAIGNTCLPNSDQVTFRWNLDKLLYSNFGMHVIKMVSLQFLQFVLPWVMCISIKCIWKFKKTYVVETGCLKGKVNRCLFVHLLTLLCILCFAQIPPDSFSSQESILPSQCLAIE